MEELAKRGALNEMDLKITQNPSTPVQDHTSLLQDINESQLVRMIHRPESNLANGSMSGQPANSTESMVVLQSYQGHHNIVSSIGSQTQGIEMQNSVQYNPI